MDKVTNYQIVDIAVCVNCNMRIIAGTIVCPGCNKRDPKIKYEHFALTVKPTRKKSQRYESKT